MPVIYECPWHGRTENIWYCPGCYKAQQPSKFQVCKQCKGLHKESECDFFQRGCLRMAKEIKHLEKRIKQLELRKK